MIYTLIIYIKQIFDLTRLLIFIKYIINLFFQKKKIIIIYIWKQVHPFFYHITNLPEAHSFLRVSLVMMKKKVIVDEKKKEDCPLESNGNSTFTWGHRLKHCCRPLVRLYDHNIVTIWLNKQQQIELGWLKPRCKHKHDLHTQRWLITLTFVPHTQCTSTNLHLLVWSKLFSP